MQPQPIHGTYHDGQIQWDTPPDWPEGQRVVIVPANVATNDSDDVRSQPTWGLEESLWPDTPENNAEIVRRMQESEPLEMTPEEEVEWEEARKWMKDYNIAAVRKQMGLDP